MRCCNSYPRFRDGQNSVCAASSATTSIRLTLDRLQLQGELQSKKEAVRLYKGVFHGVGVILKNEGPKGLLRGLGCAVRNRRPQDVSGGSTDGCSTSIKWS